MNYPLQEYQAMLAYIDPSEISQDDWLQVCMAAHAAGVPYADIDAWNQKDPARYDAKKNAERWASFNGMKGIQPATLHKFAKAWGYKYPEYPELAKGYTPAPQGNGQKPPAHPAFIDASALKPAELPADTEETTDDELMGHMRTFLAAVYRSDEHILLCSDSATRSKGGKYSPRYLDRNIIPAGALYAATKTDPQAIIEKLDEFAGAWVVINPYTGQADPTGKRTTADCIAAYRHVLIESDEMPIDMQIAFYRAMRLPVSVITHSGGKSAHAVVKVEADNPKEYARRVKCIFDVMQANGFKIDKANKNPNRFTRLAGVIRGETGKEQRILEMPTNPETGEVLHPEYFGSYAEWEIWAKEQERAATPAQGEFRGEVLPFNLAKRKEFPLHLLPETLQRFCREISDEVSSPVDFAAVGLLGFASAAIAGKFKTQVHSGYSTENTLFTMIVGNPSTAKSPIYKKLIEPINVFRMEEQKRLMPLILENRAKRAELQKRLKAVNKRIEQCTDIIESGQTKKGLTQEQAETDLPKLNLRKMELEQELAQTPIIEEPRIYISGDITHEAFVNALMEQNGRVSILSDEASAFTDIVGGGQYSGGLVKTDPYIHMYDGDGQEQIRLQSATRYIPESHGAIVLYGQPIVKDDFFFNKRVNKRGLTARFCPIEPVTRMIAEGDKREPASGEALEFYRLMIRGLLDVPYPDDVAGAFGFSDVITAKGIEKRLNLTTDAYYIFDAYRVGTLNSGRSEDANTNLSEFAGKQANKAVRLAAILHSIRNYADPTATPIDAQEMRDGIELADYFYSHIEYMFGIGARSTEAEKAAKLIKRLRGLDKHPNIMQGREFAKLFPHDDVLGNSTGLRRVLDFLELRGVVQERFDMRARNATAKTLSPYQVNQNIFTDEGVKAMGFDPAEF